MTLFVQIVYVLITVVLILVVLLQAGRGGGLGTALGGGASQTVFGGSGGADFLAKLTQGLAIGFMVCAVYLAYASAHSGSDRLQAESEKLASEERLVEGEQEVDYEAVGPNPLRLPPASARASAPAPAGGAPEAEPEAPAVADGGA
ncbi:MAG: preprotein translocase subunit SecG [Nannocystaceae bacterium]|nr:preprotein translocase subunit SecG [Nannocystaceae bacterium]